MKNTQSFLFDRILGLIIRSGILFFLQFGFIVNSLKNPDFFLFSKIKTISLSAENVK